MRFANREKHSEGITSRPLLLHGVARQTISGRQKTFIITPTHGKAKDAQERLGWMHRVLNWIKAQAEQLGIEDRWNALLSIIFSKFLAWAVTGIDKIAKKCCSVFGIWLTIIEFRVCLRSWQKLGTTWRVRNRLIFHDLDAK